MYKTIRMLPALLLLALGTACTNDPADTPAATGLPLVLEHVYIGTSTKADPYEPGFADGSRLEATIALDGVITEGTYVYQDGQWTSDATAYWQNTTEAHDVTLCTPQPSPATPAEGFTIDNWRTYDVLEYSQTTTATTSFALEHTRAQFCIALVKGTGMTDEELNSASVTTNNIKMLHTDDAHYGLFNPDTEITSVEIDINGSKYPYTPQYGITLEKGKCTILTLKVNKVGVSGITISGEDWKNVTGTAAIDDTFTQIACNGTDNITIPEKATKLLITGTLTENDVTAINNAKNQIAHLYVTATADENVWNSLKMSISTGGGPGTGEMFSPNNTLQSICITQATNIGENAFNYCTALENAYLPKAVTIGDDAFNNCESLTSISLPAATYIGEEAFYDCESLTNISLPAATNIADFAFQQCDNLTSISLPAATYIGYGTFYNCLSLTTISLSKDAANNIGNQAFYGCYLLITLHLPDLTAEEFEANPGTYISLGGVNWQHIYYNGGEWHRDENN